MHFSLTSSSNAATSGILTGPNLEIQVLRTHLGAYMNPIPASSIHWLMS